MEELHQLYQLIRQTNSAELAILRTKLKTSPKLSALFELISQHESISNTQAINTLYSSKVNSSTFSELKKRLKARLLKSILDATWGADSTEPLLYHQHLSLSWTAIYFVINSDIHPAGIKLAEELLRKSLKHEFIDLALQISRTVVRYFSNTEYNPKKLNHYSALTNKLLWQQTAELAAERACFELSALHLNSQRTVPSQELESILSKHDSELIKYQGCATHRFIKLSSLYKIQSYEISGESDLAHKVAQEAIKLLSDKQFDLPRTIISLRIRVISTSIKLGQYNTAVDAIQSSLPSIPKHSISWLAIQLYNFILQCRVANYTNAYTIATEASQCLSLRTIPIRLKQLWHILNAYAHFFAHTGLAQLTDEELANLKRFRIYKFLNDVPVFSKDKRGMNITILILHVLFLLWNGKLADASDRITALKAYSRKYLIHDETYRSNCFIKMLAELDKGDFHPIRGQRYAQKYCDKLAEVPLSKSLQGIEVEIVPYEHLWEMVIDLCKRHHNK